MNFKSCVAALSLCLLPLVSQAGIIYEWRPLNNETPKGITLALEFDRKTMKSGEFSFSMTQDVYSGEPLSRSGLLGLRYTFPGASEAMRYSRKDGFETGYGSLDMELKFDADGYLSGYIYAHNSRHHVEMASMERSFTVIDANSDEGMPSAECGWTTDIDCAGATGEIRRAAIPEPGSIALMGLGLFAAAALRRKAAP